MRTITVSELKQRMSDPADRSIDCLGFGTGTTDLDCGRCIFSHKDGCGGHTGDIDWDRMYEHLSPMDDKAEVSILDLESFVINKKLPIEGFMME